MSDKIKYIDITEFRAEGFLQEANRLFFHPRGLALEVRTDTKEDIKKEVHRWWDEFISDDVLDSETLHNFLALLSHFGIGEGERLSGVWDYRDDPEGVCFGEFDKEKATNVAKEYDRHTDARIALFGNVIQAEPYTPPKPVKTQEAE